MRERSRKQGCSTRLLRCGASRIVVLVLGAVFMNAGLRSTSLPAADRVEPGVSEPPKGSLVIIGGSARHDNAAIWTEVLRLAGGQGKRIAVFPSASSYPIKNGERAVKLLRSHGADAFLVPLALSGIDGMRPDEVARDPQWVEQVRNSHGVFFIGGSQSRIRDALVQADGANTPLLDAVWDVYQRGGVVSGTSAGAAIMSRVMFRDAGVVLNTMLHGVRMGKEMDQGLGFLDGDWFVDQHCLVRGRFARAIVAMQAQNMHFGLGIDEDTAVVVEHGGQARVVGNRGAVVLDLSQSRSDAQSTHFNIHNARLTYLNHGDEIHLRTLAVTPNPQREVDRKIDPNASDFKPTVQRRLFFLDVLANTTLVDIMHRVIDHKDGLAVGLAFDGGAASQGSTPGFEFRFYRGEDSLGWETEDHGTTDCTVQNIHLDIRPVTIHGPLYGDRDPSEENRLEKAGGAVAGGPTSK
ncbi:MAG: cyanophycinase [Pirellulales bacterium]